MKIDPRPRLSHSNTRQLATGQLCAMGVTARHKTSRPRTGGSFVRSYYFTDLTVRVPLSSVASTVTFSPA
jgi:hypothetical protein